jgi:transposase
LIGIEACGGAHHWARELTAQGHAVRLIHAKAVRPFVNGNKTDATDARAIWLAIQQPGTKFVGVKTLAQQATLTLHRQREMLMRMKIMQINALRGLLYEFGATLARGKKALLGELELALEALANSIPQYVVDSLREQAQRIKQLAIDIKAIEVRLAEVLRIDVDMKRVAAIPGVGLLSATAAIATMGEAKAFKSGREFCAWLGLVPKQRGTGGRVNLGDLQTGRHLPADFAYSRCACGTETCERARPMAGTASSQEANERCDRGTGGQDGANDLGRYGPTAGLPTRPPEHQAAWGLNG